MQKWRQREAKSFPQGHTESKRQMWDLNSSNLNLEHVPLLMMFKTSIIFKFRKKEWLTEWSSIPSPELEQEVQSRRNTVHFCRFYSVQAGCFRVYPLTTCTRMHAHRIMLYPLSRLGVGTWAHGLMLLEMKEVLKVTLVWFDLHLTDDKTRQRDMVIFAKSNVLNIYWRLATYKASWQSFGGGRAKMNKTWYLPTRRMWSSRREESYHIYYIYNIMLSYIMLLLHIVSI